MAGTSTRKSPQNAGLAVNIRGFEGSGRFNMIIDGVRPSFRFIGHEARGFVYVDPVLLAGVDVARCRRTEVPAPWWPSPTCARSTWRASS